MSISKYGHSKENVIIFINKSKMTSVTTYSHMHTIQAHVVKYHIFSLERITYALINK